MVGKWFINQIGMYSVKKGILSPASCFVVCLFVSLLVLSCFLYDYSFWNCWFHGSCPKRCLMNMTYLFHEFLSKRVPKSRNICCDCNKEVLLITFSRSNFNWLKNDWSLNSRLLGPFTACSLGKNDLNYIACFRKYTFSQFFSLECKFQQAEPQLHHIL